MPIRRLVALLGVAIGLAATVATTFGDTAPSVLRPGLMNGGVTLLPNGWKLAPAGQHIQTGDLPLSMLESPSGDALLVATNGFQKPTITVVDLRNRFVTEAVTLDHAWLGLAWHPDGKRFFVSGAGNNTVHEMFYADGKVTRGVDIALGRPMDTPGQGLNRPEPVPQSFVGGLAITPDGQRLFAVHVFGQIISVVELRTGRVLKSIALPAEPYTCVVSPDGTTLYVSVWGGAKVMAFDTKTFEPLFEVPVGEHPNALAFSKDGARLFVACANTNAVWSIDLAARRASEQISIALYPQAPNGSTPNHVSVSPDGTRLLVANADNNTVAMVDISKPGDSQVLGFIPTGWYPTASMFARDGKQIYVLSGKGLASAANPRFRRRDLPWGEAHYIGSMLTGTLSLVPTPDEGTLKALTKTVYSLTPYSDATRLAPANAPVGSPIPRRVGDPSPIKHVFYVIRENRSYDQVFGDLGRGNGDPALTLFGEDVTPNAHALAREFGTFDNFYVDAEVSSDGHNYSTAAYATDIVEKFWPLNYAGRGAGYISEGGGQMRNAYGNAAAPMNGYVWDAVLRAKLTVRSYGEFVYPGRDRKNLAQVPGLQGNISMEYPPYNLSIPDQTRADVFIKELRDYEANGQLPSLSIIRLGNDHTSATTVGMPTPRAAVADNDLALGRIVEAISHSKYWKESAIFVLEDDAQNGPDHIDAHRSPALVISPFSKRTVVDSTMYSTASMLRTIELILGLEPMSQLDAAARPFYAAFQATPVLTPFMHLENRVPLDEKNTKLAYGADRAALLNLAEADLAPDAEMNDLIWHAVKGPHVPLPPSVRSAFIRRHPAGLADDDDD